MQNSIDQVLRLVGVGILGATFVGSACADDQGGINELRAKFEQSLKVIEMLNARVSQLEKQIQNGGKGDAVTPGAVSNAPQAQTQKIEELERQVSQLSESVANKKEEGLPLHGFFDAGVAQSSSTNMAGLPQAMQERAPSRGFRGGTVDFYLTPAYGRIKALAEIAVEFEENKTGNPGIDIERLQVGYTFEDFTIWLGRFHTPYGYWNTAYHHGAELQPSLSRPNFLNFEDHLGIMPAHSVGVWVAGAHKMPFGKLLYDFYGANGDSIETDGNSKALNFGTYTDDNPSKEIGFRLAADFPSGLQIGLHGYRDGVNTYTNGTSTALGRTQVAMLGAYAYFEDDNWNLLGEYYHFNNKTLLSTVAGFDSGSHHASNLWFVQGGYTLGANWFPYLRYEQTGLDAGDIYFASLDGGFGYKKAALGLRYNFDARSALKFELGHTRIKSSYTLNTSGAPQIETYTGTTMTDTKVQFSTSF